MRAPPLRSMRSQVGRADLLRALASGLPGNVALEDSQDGWFGYVRRAPVQEWTLPEPPHRERPPPSVESAQPTGYRVPLRMPVVPAIVDRVQRDAEPESERGEREGIGLAELEGDAGDTAIPMVRPLGQDLLPMPRLLPRLRKFVGIVRPGPLDVPRLTNAVAARQVLRSLPHQQSRQWHPDLVVILDFSRRLVPYYRDMHRLARVLLRLCGRTGVSIRIFDEGPGAWKDWVASQDRGKSLRPKPWTMPSPGSPVLVLSDLGLFARSEVEEFERWRAFIDLLKASGSLPTILAPIGTHQQSAAARIGAPVLRWSPDASPFASRASAEVTNETEAIGELLAMIAVTRRAQPSLIRALRALNTTAPLDASLEGMAWNHPHVFAGAEAEIRLGSASPHLHAFEQFTPAVQNAVRETISRCHGDLRPILQHEEHLVWMSHADPALANDEENRKKLARAEACLRRLAGSLSADPVTSDLLPVARRILRTSDDAMGRLAEGALRDVLAAVLRVPGNEDAVPDWVDLRWIEQRLPPSPPTDCWLVQDSASGRVLLQVNEPGKGQVPLGPPIQVGEGGVRLRGGAFGGGAVRWTMNQLPVAVSTIAPAKTLTLETARETLTLAWVTRPRGAATWWCDCNGLQVRSPFIHGDAVAWGLRDLEFTGQLDTRASHHLRSASTMATWRHPERHRFKFGMDAGFGVFAEIDISTKYGTATQRFRWIEPGNFLMGSPEDEPERSNDEGPQHLVTITRGFWLADTACTQALWLAVMGGKNPAAFSDDLNNPVEQVSWNDVQRFLTALGRVLPGCEPGLPTEAQWEYACRAGTTTPFSFGEQITPEQVNYEGIYPYAGGEKGKYRGKTAAVKSFPANAWGLYEMHGNVWEWCADGKREYGVKSQEDPEGPGGEHAHRALRGGSWNIYAGRARSAGRDSDGPGFVDGGVGFRLCLRSSEPGEVARPGGTGGVAPGGREVDILPPRDEAGFFERVLGRFNPFGEKKDS